MPPVKALTHHAPQPQSSLRRNAKAQPSRKFAAEAANEAPARLQQVAGNQALATRQWSTGGAAHPRTVLQRLTDRRIQRFPASVMTLPYGGWQADNPNIASPGEGAKGGVFIFTDPAAQQGDVRAVVMKPLKDEKPAQTQFGDAVLSIGFDINTPQSRIIRGGTPEFDMIMSMVKPIADQHAPVDLSQTPQWANMSKGEQEANMNAVMAYVPISETKSFKLMAAIQGDSLSSLASKADDQQKVDRLLTIVRTNPLMQKIGTIAVADAVMGNDDRLSITTVKQMTNLGNYMFTGNNDLVAIDTTARLAQAASLAEARKTKVMGTGGGDSLMEIFARPNAGQQLADLFFTALRGEVAKATVSPNFNPTTYFDQQLRLNTTEVMAKAQIMRGIQIGLTRLKAMVLGESGDAINRRTRLQEAAKERYGAEGQHLASWESIEGNYVYKEAFASELQAGTANNELSNRARTSMSDYLIEKADSTLYEPIMPVDVGALSRSVPGEINKKATSAKKAVFNNQLNPVDVLKWVGRYSPDMHVHSLRVGVAIEDKDAKLKAAMPAIQQSLQNAPQGELGRARREKHEHFAGELGKQSANLLVAANLVKSRLEQMGQKKYNAYIGTLAHLRQDLTTSINQFTRL